MRKTGIDHAATTARRQNIFDFIRLMAALAVVVEHSVHHLRAQFLWHGPEDSLWFNGGVATFFILSGMMVFRSGERAHAEGRLWRDFYMNRALRIVPAIYAYVGVLVVLLVVAGVIAAQQVATLEFAAFVATNLLLIPVWSPPMLEDFGIGVVNGSLWTIPVEVSFYAIVPVMVLLVARRGWRQAMALILLVAAASVVAYGMAGATGTESLIWKLFGVSFAPYLWWFAIGMAWSKLWPLAKQSGWLAAGSVALYFVLAKLPLETGPAFIANAVAAIPLSYAVIWLGYNGPEVLRRLTDRVGDLSFSVYIWHMIVVNAAVTWGARSWYVDGTLLVLGVVVVTSIIAFTSWHLVEKRALRRKRYTSAKDVASANTSPKAV